MKKQILKLTAVAALMAVSVGGFAESITVGATMASAITLDGSSVTTINFGTILPPGGAGASVFSLATTGGTVSVSSGTARVLANGTSGSLVINGSSGAGVTLTWPGSPVTLSNGASFLPTSPLNPTTCTLTSGTCTVGFGGQLTIPNNISASSTTGSVTVTLSYT